MKAPQNKTGQNSINKLAALHELTLRINSAQSVDDLISTAIGQLVNVTRPDVVFFYLRQADKLLLKDSWQGTGEKSTIAPEVKDVGVCLCGLAASEKRAVYSLDIHKDALCTLSECKEAGIKSFAALPLFGKSEVIGLLCLASFTERDFKEQSVFLEILTNAISIAMANEFTTSFLFEAKQSLEAIIQASPLPIFTLDREGKVRLWNHAAEKTFGWTSDEAVGQVNPIVPENKRDEFQALFKRLIDGEDLGGIELRRSRKDGVLLDIKLYTSQIRDTSGSVVGLMSIIEDITERKRAEEELRKKEYLLSDSQRLAHIGSWALEIESGSLTWTDETYRIYGQLPATFILTHASFVDLLHADDRPVMQEWIGACLAGEAPGELVFRSIMPDGAVRFLTGRGHLQRDADDKPVRMVGTVQDITERLHTEELLQESEEMLRAIFDNTNEGILMANPETRKFSFANNRICQMLGYSPSEIRNLGVGDIHPEEDLPSILSQFEKQAKGEIALTENVPVRRKDGTIFYADINASPVPFGGRNYIAGFFTDITKRKKAEEQQRYLSEVIERSLNEVYVFDAETLLFEYINYGALKNLRYTLDEIKKLTPLDLKPEFSEKSFRAMLQPLLAGEKDLQLFETVHRRADGSLYPVEVHLQFMSYKNKRVFLAFIYDITERKKTEEALQESELRFKSLLQTAADAIIMSDSSGNILLWNNGAEAIFGYTEDEVKGRPLTMLMPERYRNDHIKGLERVITTGQSTYLSRIMDFYGLRKDGTEFPLELSVNAWQTEKGTYFLGIIRDISDREKIKKDLEESQTRLQTIINSEPHCVKLISKDGIIIEMNPAGLALIEADYLEQVKGQSLCSFIAPACREAFKNHVAEVFRGDTGTLEFEVIGLKGTHRWLSTHSVPFRNSQGEITALLGITRDITEHKRLEDQLRQAQKMEAIGQLAGGVAHDFNNMLSAIIGYAHLTTMKMKDDDPLRTNIDHILQASERATTLTHSLLAFSRKQPVVLRPVELNELIRNFYKFMLRLLTENIDLKVSYAKENLQTMIDRGQIEQVLMNLITNARDAMPDGGRITIETRLAEIDKQSTQTTGLEKAGDYALIMVTDTGSGIDRETIKKVFEPFFTTKESGKGTGLGLAMAYGIIKKHNGNINVYSEPGKGTSFRIYLPLQKTASEEQAEPEKSQPARGGSEKILIAEDDEALRKLSKTVLTHYGYNVIDAVDGEDAVEKFIRNKDSVNLVILDGIMPKKNGKAAYEEITAVNPEIKVIFMSGYSEDVFKSKEVTEKGVICLLKPVTPDDLIKKVREALDR